MDTTNRILAAVLGVLLITAAAAAGLYLLDGQAVGQGGRPPASAGPSSTPSATPMPVETPAETPAPAETLSAYVLASSEGVVRRVGGRDTRVTSEPARTAYGVDDLVAYETGRDPADTGEVRVWSPRGDRRVILGGGAVSSRLLGAGALSGRPVAVVAELIPSPEPAERPQDASERLVAVDLAGGARTIFSDGDPAYEEGWLAAHVLPGGDLIAERYASVTGSLVRLSGAGGEEWRRKAVVDRSHGLAAIGARISIVVTRTTQASRPRTRLRVDTYVADGSRAGRDRISLARDAPQVDRCLDWYDTDRLACTGGDGPLLVTARGDDRGAVESLPGVGGAILTAIATTG